MLRKTGDANMPLLRKHDGDDGVDLEAALSEPDRLGSSLRDFCTLAKMPCLSGCIRCAATGLGISLSAAFYLRTAAIVVCASLMVAMCLIHFSRVRITGPARSRAPASD